MRVQVLGTGAEPDKSFVRTVQAKVTPLKPERSRLISKAGWSVRLFHPTTVRSLDAWLAGTKSAALTKAIEILHAEVRSPEAMRRITSKRRVEIIAGLQEALDFS